MKTDAAELYMRCFRTDAGGRDPLFRKAMDAAQKDERLRPLAEEQLAFDQWALDRVREIEVPDETLGELAEALASPRQSHSWKNPAVLSVAFGLILIAGVFAYFWWLEQAAFDGRGEVERMVERTAKMTGRELQPMAMKLGDLEDWLFMQGVQEMALPPGFKGLTATGARVFQQKGNPVVQLALDEHDVVAFLFETRDFGIRLPTDGKWTIFTVDEWVAAVQALPANGVMLAMRGSRADMRDELAAIEDQAAKVLEPQFTLYNGADKAATPPAAAETPPAPADTTEASE